MKSPAQKQTTSFTSLLTPRLYGEEEGGEGEGEKGEGRGREGGRERERRGEGVREGGRLER